MAYPSSNGALGPPILGIPLALWVAICVPILALAGVIWQTRIGRLNLRDQLRHDAVQRDLERKATLRKEVFLKAAEIFPHANSLVSRITDLNYDQRELVNEFAKHLEAFARVHVVGNDKTVEATLAYVNTLGPAVMESLRARTMLTIRRNEIEATKVQANLARFEQLQTMQIQDQVAAGERSIELTIDLVDRQTAALSAIREEMDLPIDIDRYRQLLEAQFESMRAEWLKSKEQLQELLDKGLRESFI